MEYILVSVQDTMDVNNLNRNYLEKGWEVVSSVSQHMGGANSKSGMIIFTLRRSL